MAGCGVTGTSCLGIIINVLCVGVVSIGVLVLRYAVGPFHRGFFCNDESLMHPFGSNTVPTWLLGVVGLGLPAMVIFLCEGLAGRHFGKDLCSLKKGPKGYPLRCYQHMAPFLFGVAMTQFLTEVGKNSIGRLRPHFLTLCAPDHTKFNCSDGYILGDVCTGTNLAALREARLSFPSGHASISVYCMLFLMAYLEARLLCQKLLLLKPVLQGAAFSMALFTCLSRISDYKHHWSDVLGGFMLGLAVAFITVRYLCVFPRRRHSGSGAGMMELPLHIPHSQDSSSQIISEHQEEAPTFGSLRNHNP